MRRLLMVVLLWAVSITSFSIEQEAKASNRIDFSGSQVRGQSNKSGAVYLMNRKKNEIRSMLKKRKHYRKEILDMYPELNNSNK